MGRRILLLSDTHGTWDDFIEKYAARADEIWHAGDIGSLEVLEKLQQFAPVKAVYGNADGRDIRIRVPEHLFFQQDGKGILILHIGGYPGRYTPLARRLIDTYAPDVFISGHSHILKVMPDKKRGLMHLNPGAAGKYGFHKVRTMLRFEMDDGQLKNLEVIERPR